MTKRILLTVASALTLNLVALGNEIPAAVPGGSMKMTLKVGEKTLGATLIDSRTSRDFVSLLPITMTMNDLFRREKFAPLPRSISTEGKRTHSYEAGSIGYWSPGPDLAIYHQNDGGKIPDPGIILIGKIDSGADVLNVPGPVKVTIDLVRK